MEEKKINTYASAAFSLTVSTIPLTSCSALSLFDSFDNSDFFSSTLSFTASIPNEEKKTKIIRKIFYKSKKKLTMANTISNRLIGIFSSSFVSFIAGS